MSIPGRVEWAPARELPIAVEGPDDAAVVVLLAHGAGAGPGHPFMAGMRDRLAERGILVVTFPYPYVAEGRRLPDRLEVLIAAHRAVVAALPAGRSLILAGKSMGGRVGSQLADAPAAGLVFLGYPLVPIGKTAPRDTSHLDALRAPMLFIQGERDRLAPLDILRPIVDRLAGASLVVIPEADHSFRVPKRAGVDESGMLDRLAALVADWQPVRGAGGRSI